MKRFIRPVALAAAILLALPLAACGGRKADVGPRLEHNTARFYSPSERVSRFTIDCEPVPGKAKGRAFMETSARGNTGLAWVDTAVYFVSAAGVDALGTGIAAAEISFDGGKALFLDGNALKLYSVDTRASQTIDSGISSIVQFAFSPSDESIAFTAYYEYAPETIRTKLYKDGQLTEPFAGRSVIVLAVSDKADIIWYREFAGGEVCVECGGERTVVSENCGADANYNFTNDLREAAFNTSDGMNHLWRLDTKTSSELGEGFDYTLKTDVFSISTKTLFTYINDVDTFTDGFWQKRVRNGNGYLYSIGFIDGSGNIKWLAESAECAAAAPDGSRAAWVKGGLLYSTDLEGKNTRLASEVDSIAFSDDPGELFFTSGDVLYFVKDLSRPERISSGVAQYEVMGGRCVFVRGDGALCCADSSKAEELMSGFASIEKRAGQLLAYADPVSEGDQTVYKAYVSPDGRSFTLVGEGIQP